MISSPMSLTTLPPPSEIVSVAMISKSLRVAPSSLISSFSPSAVEPTRSTKATTS